MTSNPLFSVVIPAYNAGSSISSLINKFIKQDYARMEIIVVDDGFLKMIPTPYVKFYPVNIVVLLFCIKRTKVLARLETSVYSMLLETTYYLWIVMMTYLQNM